jgi:cobalt-zinc-cadmium efflux system outer membrane protein
VTLHLASLLFLAISAPAPSSTEPRPATSPPTTTGSTAVPPATPTGPTVSVEPSDHGEDPDDPRVRVSLTQVFDLLKRKSPRYKAYQADIDVAKAEVAASRVLPNPQVNLAILYLNSGFNQNGVGTYYANATVPLLIAGQRRMRVKTAKVGVKSAEADLKVNFHVLAHEARDLFVEMQADQARLVIYDEALASLTKLQALVEARRTSGVETAYSTLRIDVETAAWKARRAEAEAEAQDVAGRLGVLLGIPEFFPEAEGELAILGVSGDADRMWPEVERTQPEILAASRNEAYAVKTIDLARRERWPVPTVTAGTVAIQNYYSISTQFGITVPIPMFDWGQGMIARAKTRSKRAGREKEAVIASTKAELKRALRLLRHHKRALATFDTDVGAKMPVLEQMAEDSFRAGDSELIDLLDATRTRFEVKLTRVDLLESTVEAEVDVLAVTGRIEEVVPR